MYITIIVTVFVLAAGAIIIFNRFIRLRALMQEAWSGVDVQLKRRHDLIPAIVDTVKGYAHYEKNLMEEITRMRGSMMTAMSVKEKGAAENGLSQTLKSIFAVAENYPDLKANQNFLNLQKTLVDTEDQIQMARRYYNGTTRNYNILAESFPSNLIARAFNFKGADYFEIEYATERKVPDVKM